MAPDALIASRMNQGPGGVHVPKMREGWFVRGGERVSQAMQDSQGVPKGIKAVLMERGLWPSGGVRLDCNDSCPERSTSCCARKIMASQPDFQAQKSSIAEVIESAGHTVEFYPKFHCECNFIERVWGEAKKVARDQCDYSFKSLEERVPKILKGISLAHIRRYQRKAWRYMHAYSLKLPGRVAEWAVKKYKSHRRVQGSLDDPMEEMEKEKERD